MYFKILFLPQIRNKNVTSVPSSSYDSKYNIFKAWSKVAWYFTTMVDPTI